MERTEPLAVAATAPPVPAGPILDWAAVLAGAIVAAALATVFALFGAALGLTTISAEPGEGGSAVLWMAVTAIWAVLSLALVYLAGGYVAGRMRRRVEAADPDEIAARDTITGLVVWGSGMLLSAWLAAGMVAGMAGMVTGAAGAVAESAGSAVETAAETAGQAAGALAPEALAGEIGDRLMRPPPTALTAPSPAAGPDGTALARQGASVLAGLLRDGNLSDEDRAFLVAATARTSGLSPAEAEARVTEALAAVDEARAEAARLRDEAEETARAAAELARVSAVLTGFLLAAAALVAAAAAVVGAVRGGRHRDEGRIYGGLGYRLRS